MFLKTTLFQSVTYLFTFPTTKKDKLSRQMDDAENECDIRLIFIFAR